MKSLILLVFAFCSAALGADIDGTWKATADFNGQTIERTFVFKSEGAKLTGESTSEMMGKSTISDGKIEGDNVSFSMLVKFQDNEMKLDYKGKVSGNQLKLTVEIPGGGPAIEWNAKKTS